MTRRASIQTAKKGRRKSESEGAVREPSHPRVKAITSTTGATDAEPAAADVERDALRARLAAAEARIAELEQASIQVIDRIGWVIDTLSASLEKQP